MTPFNPDSEGALEANTIRLFEELGWEATDCYYEKCGDNSTLGRQTTEEVVLDWRLKSALEKLNPEVPPLALDLAVDEITKDRSVLSPVRANQEIYKLLKEGVRITYRAPDGDEDRTETVTIIDWSQPRNNDFFLASQFWISGEYGRKRADLIGFVNGIPLLFIELSLTDP
jgi:type I restriction enzyme R subunit